MAQRIQEWSGSVATIPGRLSFSGRLGDAAEHTHAAVQIVQVRRGYVELHADGQVTRVATAAAIPTATPHRLVAGPDAWGTITYLDADRVSDEPGVQLDPSVINEWLREPVVAAALHPVVRRALDRSREQVGGSLLLRDLAADLGVSPSRLGHLFAEQLGMGFPAWRRWVRPTPTAGWARSRTCWP